MIYICCKADDHMLQMYGCNGLAGLSWYADNMYD